MIQNIRRSKIEESYMMYEKGVAKESEDNGLKRLFASHGDMKDRIHEVI